MNASEPGRLRACLISLTNCTSEPRLLRQIWTLQQRGWQVTVVGYPGTNPIPSSWDFHDVTPQASNGEQTARGWGASLLKAARLPARLVRYCLRRLRQAIGLGSEVSSQLDWRIDSTEAAFKLYWQSGVHRYVLDAVLPRIPQSHLVIAHDYYTLPLANWIANRDQSAVVGDIHEYAIEQYHYSPGSEKDRYWREVQRPMVDAIQATHLPQANGLTTICDGIRDLLKSDYPSIRRIEAVRSTPVYEPHPWRPTRSRISVVYHGLINEMRHLDVAVRSLRLWHAQFHLTLRGPASPEYVEALLRLAEQSGVSDRLSIQPPVPFKDLIGSAAESDVGYLAFDMYSRQRVFAAPNKFFEYMMAGLALVTMDTPELSKITSTWGNAVTASRFDESTIANAINSLTVERIDYMKKRSLEAAKLLCWENEQIKMIEAYQLERIEAAYAAKAAANRSSVG